MSESVQVKKPVNSCQFTTIFILKSIHGFRNFHLAGKLEKQAGKLSLLSLSAHAPPPKGRKGWGQIDTNYWTFQSVRRQLAAPVRPPCLRDIFYLVAYHIYLCTYIAAAVCYGSIPSTWLLYCRLELVHSGVRLGA